MLIPSGEMAVARARSINIDEEDGEIEEAAGEEEGEGGEVAQGEFTEEERKRSGCICAHRYLMKICYHWFDPIPRNMRRAAVVTMTTTHLKNSTLNRVDSLYLIAAPLFYPLFTS